MHWYCECIRCIWMSQMLVTCSPRSWALVFRGRSCIQIENAATSRSCCYFQRPRRHHQTGFATHSRILSQFVCGFSFLRRHERRDATRANSQVADPSCSLGGLQELRCCNPPGAPAGSGSPDWVGGIREGPSRHAWPRAPRGGVRAARVRGRPGARRVLPRPGVCLPTNCRRSAATHSNALNKLLALAVCSRLPGRFVAAGSEPPCRSPRVEKRARRFPAPPPPLLCSPRPLVIPAPPTPLRFCRQDRGVRRPPPSSCNPGTRLWERAPKIARPGASERPKFPYGALPRVGGGPQLQASVRSPRAVANPGSLSGRGPRRVPGTKPKSEKRGAPWI